MMVEYIMAGTIYTHELHTKSFPPLTLPSSFSLFFFFFKFNPLFLVEWPTLVVTLFAAVAVSYPLKQLPRTYPHNPNSGLVVFSILNPWCSTCRFFLILRLS